MRVTTFLLALFVSSIASATDTTVWIAETDVTEPQVLQDLVESEVSIGRVSDNTAKLYLSETQYRQLLAQGISLQVVGQQPDSSKGYTGYYDYASLTARLEELAEAYPYLCRLESIGTSEQGRELWVMRISDYPGQEEDEPEFKYVGSIHGDEPVGMELCLAFIELLLSEYSSDTRIRALVDNTEIWVLPLMNPDGLEVPWRFNANFLDLNRSFPKYPEDYESRFYEQTEVFYGYPAEVEAVMAWTVANRFVMSANIHAGEIVVNYPYDDDGGPSGVDAPSPDDGIFEALALEYASANIAMWYSASFDYGITNGAEWYVVRGSMQDWNYRYAGCLAVTLEVSYDKVPTATRLQAIWQNENRESMLRYAEAAQWGVHGIVASSTTGAPLLARVRVEGAGSAFYTDPTVGDYHRPLLPGEYTLIIDADGYATKRVEHVTVTARGQTRVDVELLPPIPADRFDVNGDGDGEPKVDAVDVQLVINAVLNGGSTQYDCDIDQSGVISAVDVQLVINAALGLI